jgi:hypothetical protein
MRYAIQCSRADSRHRAFADVPPVRGVEDARDMACLLARRDRGLTFFVIDGAERRGRVNATVHQCRWTPHGLREVWLIEREA